MAWHESMDVVDWTEDYLLPLTYPHPMAFLYTGIKYLT